MDIAAVSGDTSDLHHMWQCCHVSGSVVMSAAMLSCHWQCCHVMSAEVFMGRLVDQQCLAHFRAHNHT